MTSLYSQENAPQAGVTGFAYNIKETGRELKSLIGDKAFLSKLKARDFADARFGEPTVKDILKELEKPGRDPRPCAAAVAPGFVGQPCRDQ